jgi:hypothetical protein
VVVLAERLEAFSLEDQAVHLVVVDAITGQAHRQSLLSAATLAELQAVHHLLAQVVVAQVVSAETPRQAQVAQVETEQIFPHSSQAQLIMQAQAVVVAHRAPVALQVTAVSQEKTQEQETMALTTALPVVVQFQLVAQAQQALSM